MLDRIRTLLVVLEEGSLNRAAVRLRMSQPALSRQMKALEHELGGALLERETSGVKPTALAHTVIERLGPVLESYESALAEVRRQARGLTAEVRVGYLISAAESVLTPAMDQLRESSPDVKLRLFDMSPREQIEALREGKIDVALAGQEGASGANEFYTAKLGVRKVCVALAKGDTLTSRATVALKQLRDHAFIGVDEREVPGRNRWIRATCRAAGFRPRIVESIDGITHVLSAVAAEGGATLLPDYFLEHRHPGIAFRSIADRGAKWEFHVLWQRGKTPAATRAFLKVLREVS